MPEDRLLEQAQLIPREELAEHLVISLAGAVAAGLPHVADWHKASISKEPMEIFDINGTLLFLDYPVSRGQEVCGYVRSAASRIVGNPVVSFEVGPRAWDFDAAVRKLSPLVKRSYPGARIRSPRLVCYSYPRVGVRFEVTSREGQTTAVTYDVTGLKPVPDTPGQPDREGVGMRSFYDALGDPERKARLARFHEIDRWRTRLSLADREKLRRARTVAAVSDLVALPALRMTTGLLADRDHYGYNHARSHHCFVLQGQQVDDYCAVATCQMVLCYYRYHYSQADIAPQLGYSAGGGCPADQAAGYESLTGNHLDATYDTAPTFAKCRDQIKAKHPFKSGVPGHARACAGYFEWPALSSRRLYIYDPWNWNADYAVAGAITWEDWDTVTHTNCIWTSIHLD